MTGPYAAEQVSELPGEIRRGDYVFDHDRWVQVDHVDVEGGIAVIHLMPIQCAADEAVAVCKAS